MKHEWKKSEKQFYVPACRPSLITVPEFKFFTIEGEGNPNDAFFADYIGVLYALSYGVKMSPRKGMAPEGYFDYTIYPLEGVWDLNEEGRKTYNGTFNKDHLVFKLAIRQPDFVEEAFAWKILEETKKNKPHELLAKVNFERITEGKCIQMLHLGSYNDEPETFRIMEEAAARMGVVRKVKTHREIYLSDARRVSAEKLRTVLRFEVEDISTLATVAGSI